MRRDKSIVRAEASSLFWGLYNFLCMYVYVAEGIIGTMYREPHTFG